MTRCAYMVLYAPPGCPLREGEVFYTACPPEGYCTDVYLGPTTGCFDAWILLLSCECIE